MLIPNRKRKEILELVRSKKEAGYSKKKLLVELCMDYGFPLDFAMELYELIDTMK